MKLKMFFYALLLLLLSAGVANANKILTTIGDHPVHEEFLSTKEKLCTMMQKPQVRKWIKKGLEQASCPGTLECSDFYDDIMKLFPVNTECDENNFTDEPHKQDTVFRWMMFRTKGKGNIKLVSNVIWKGQKNEKIIEAYQFNITKDGKDYTFSVPKKCGNLALLKVTKCPNCPKCDDCTTLRCKECSEDCKVNGNCESENCEKCWKKECFGCNDWDCEACSAACIKNPYGVDDSGKLCPSQCAKCEEKKCIRVVDKCKECDQCKNEIDCLLYGKNCSTKCKQCKKNECIVGIPSEDCSDWNCKACSAACIKNPGGVDESGNTCPSQCTMCKEKECVRVIDKCENCDQCKNEIDCLLYGKNCSMKCKQCKEDECIVEIPSEDCSDWNCEACSAACIKNPDGVDENGYNCPIQCAKCKNNKCLHVVTEIVNCIQPCPPSFRFIADLGYYRQSDPADYLFGRVGIEYNLSENASWLEGVSLLTMIGAAPKISGSDGDSAFLLDVIAQYNWLQSSIRGFTGLGLGGWFTSGDTEDDSADSDLDIIANIGVRVLDDPKMSIFLEMRNAVDELDSISEYGRFGAGVRIQF